MIAMRDPNRIWKDLDELAESVQRTYSVTGEKAIREQYLSQVSQYPLYLGWFDRIMGFFDSLDKQVSILEYGPGPGLLAERVSRHPNVLSYTAVEPERIFREMTRKRLPGSGRVVGGTSETYVSREKKDVVIATATYHHMLDKERSLANIRDSLKPGGMLVMADVFLPDYAFDSRYRPVDKTEFTSRVLEYTAAQILAMPNPKAADVADQIKTAILDISRIEELKVCLPICLAQLRKAGFTSIRCEHMRGNGRKDYGSLMYYLITAEKKGAGRGR